MWRRILTIMVSFVLFSNIRVASSYVDREDLYYDIIKSIAPYTINNENEKISRGDCISTIMKLIGVDKKTADAYADMDFDQPVFYDIYDDDLNAGYIILAKFSDVAVGVSTDVQNIGNFESNRYVTNKECLTFMLRCLKEPDSVIWENVMADSVKIGLLQEEELDTFAADALLMNKDFCTLLYRMLNMNRYLYWPTEESKSGYLKSMQIDQTNSIKYIDWLIKK